MKFAIQMVLGGLIVCMGCGGSPDATDPADRGQKAATLSGDYLGQTPPGSTPELFAPGVISTGLYERDVAMTPDGDELYFGLISGGYVTIVVTKRENGNWTRPEIAPFCDNPDVFDLEPHITPDGRRIMFLSTRPDEGKPPAQGWVYQDIWVADRTEDGWSEPYNLGPPVCTEAPEYFPSVTRDGTLYFTREVTGEGGKRSVIVRSRMVDGKYQEAEILPEAVNPGDMQYNAFIDPDEKYLIVGISGHEDNIGRGDYYVCFRGEDDAWTGPINMGELINTPGNNVTSPYVSPDGRYFFFASNRRAETTEDAEDQERSYDAIQRMATEPGNGSADIYWIDASYIETLRP
jgi:hypothetical protein